MELCWESLDRASRTPQLSRHGPRFLRRPYPETPCRGEVLNAPWTNENKSGGNLAFKLVTRCYISSVNILYSEVW